MKVVGTGPLEDGGFCGIFPRSAALSKGERAGSARRICVTVIADRGEGNVPLFAPASIGGHGEPSRIESGVEEGDVMNSNGQADVHGADAAGRSS